MLAVVLILSFGAMTKLSISIIKRFRSACFVKDTAHFESPG